MKVLRQTWDLLQKVTTAPDSNNVIGGRNTCIYVLICSDTRYGIIYDTLHVPLNGMQWNRSYGVTQYTLYNIYSSPLWPIQDKFTELFGTMMGIFLINIWHGNLSSHVVLHTTISSLTIWNNDGNIPYQYLTRKFIFPCSFTYHHFLFNNLVENDWRGPINYSTRFCSNIKHDCLTSIIIDYLPSNTTMHFCQTKTCIFLGNHTWHVRNCTT